ncbi:PAM68-like protein [Gracilaria domingensis]|nr:PAM68-like protein [Gracilaria domingensis]
MTGKGFGTKPKKESAKDSNKQKAEFSNGSLENISPPDAPEPFVPRGTTLRQEYERKGIIEPTYDPDAGTLPEIVANRMLRRILGFGGVPFTIFFLFFATYFVLKYKYDITVLPAVVAYSTLSTIGLATVGITYGIFSSSWDEDVDGSFFGWEQVPKNFMRAKEGLLGARQREIKEEELARIDEMVEKDSQD